jgi:hypothetical protein
MLGYAFQTDPKTQLGRRSSLIVARDISAFLEQIFTLLYWRFLGRHDCKSFFALTLPGASGTRRTTLDFACYLTAFRAIGWCVTIFLRRMNHGPGREVIHIR